MESKKITDSIKKVTLDLLAYCKKDDWAGWDPYDALNSRLFELLPFLNFKIPRLVMTQFLKRSPIDVRKPLLIPKTQNPKALALFLSASIKLADLGLQGKKVIVDLIDKIEALRSPNERYICWGYSFPWQTRDILVPRNAPNLVCTTFVANALLNAYDAIGDERCLNMAHSAAEYIATELFYADDSNISGYCYPTPDSRSRVHNANFLGAALLCRVAACSGKKQLIDDALKVVRYSASKQRENGSWDYGDHHTQRWIDNFHTGYNLCALRDIQTYTGIDTFESNLKKGYAFYINHFFQPNGAPNYFHDRDYPLDVHCVAQSIITLLTFKDLDERSERLALSVYDWSVKHLKSDQGYFYYQITPFCRNRISYIRWSQAWMLLALATLLEQTKSNGKL